MAVMKMKRICICGLKENRKQILENLQSAGVIEIEDGNDERLNKYDTSSKCAVFERNANNIETALNILDEYAPYNKSLLDTLRGKYVVSRLKYEDIAASQKQYSAEATKIIELKNNILEQVQSISSFRADIEALQPWIDADTQIGSAETKQTIIQFGILPAAVDETELMQRLSGFSAAFETVARDKNSWYLMLIIKKSDAVQADLVLRNLGFAKAPVSSDVPPKQQCVILNRKIEEAQKQVEAYEQQLVKEAKYRSELMTVADYYRVRADKYEVLGRISQSEHTFFITGFIPEKCADSIASTLEKKYNAAVELEDTDDAPVKLENNGFASSFEGVLASYGLPKKGEIDPSTIMGAFYVFLFGLMLSDAAYGALISIVCFALIRIFKNMEDSMRQALKMFMYCGLSTLFWGIMFGGFFGDAVSVISRVFFGREVTLPALWFVPLEDPMRLLLYSMLFGLIHLFCGLGIKGYMYLRDKDVKGFIFDVLSWFAFLTGLLLILMSSSIYASLAGSALNLGKTGAMIAKLLTAAGAVVILFTAGRTSRNPAIRLAKGAYSLYGITSWLSDLLSYSRLLALGLATGVIASVINQMGSMAGKGVFGTIVFVIVFIAGHIFNLAINLLGAYVHTNRLQYVEFFGKFYEGGGRVFNPFSEKTKYVKIKKDN